MIPPSLFDELEKLGVISNDQALASYQQLQKLQDDAPTAKQVGRYALVGAVGAPAINSVGNVIRKGSITPRGLAADAVKGALGASVIPLVQHELDRRSEMRTLRRWGEEHKIATRLNDAVNFTLENPHVIGGAVGGLQGADGPDMLGGAIAGGAAAHGVTKLTDLVTQHKKLPANQAALAGMLARLGSPMVGNVAGGLYSKAKGALLTPDANDVGYGYDY